MGQTRDNSKEVTVEATTENLIGIDMTKDPINETKGESTEYIERSFKDVIEKSNKDLEEKGQVESVQPTMNQEIRSNNKSDKKAHFKDGDGKTKTTDEPIDKTKGLVNMGLEKSGNESEEGEVDQKLEDSEGKESGKHKAGKPTTNKQTRYNIKDVTVEAATENLIGIYIPEDQINKRKGESKEDLEQSFKDVIEKSINDLEEKEQVDSVEPTMNQEIRSKDESDKTAHFNDGDGKTKTTDEPIDKTKGLATKGLEKSANELEEREVDQKLEDSEGKGKLRHKKESEKNKSENPTTNKQTRNDLKEILLKSTTNNLRGINIPEDPIYETKGESTEELEQSFKLKDSEGKEKLHYKKESEEHKGGKPTTNKQTRYNIKDVTVEATTQNVIGINIPEDPINETKGESKEDLEQSFKDIIEKSNNDLEEKLHVDSVKPTMNQEIRSEDDTDKTAHFKGGDGKTETTYEPREKTKVLATKGLEKSGNELDKIEVDLKWEDSEEKEKLQHKKESEKHRAGKPTTNKQTRDDLKEVIVGATTKNLIGINIPADPINGTKGESTG